LDAPAGHDGFVTIQEGHLVRPDGTRLRLWGVNVTDWTPGSVLFPSKADAPLYAATLARFGVNCVRLHFLDLPAPRGLIDDTRDDTQHFDAEQLDRLDFWVAALKQQGIYCDLNLLVGHSYKAGDGVQDADKIGWAKAVAYFDPRLIALQKAYAAQILTHRNPYTGTGYRHEPALIIIELLNENSLIEAWHGGRLRAGDGTALPAYYTDMLDQMYAAYLERRAPAEQTRIRALAGAPAGAAVSRLTPEELATAPAERFQAEAAFYMEVERDYFREMRAFLKETLGVRSLLIGSNDHTYSQSGYPMIWSNSLLDIMDGHMYWQHPDHSPARNTPMVNDPLHSTVVRLSRTALAGQPYTVSETNHLFPGDWISEGMPILAAYAGFQDWDGVMWYTFEPKRDAAGDQYVRDHFDISFDPVRMSQLAAGALLFLRGDVRAGDTTVERSYSLEQVRESLRLPPEARPYFSPGFSPLLALQHKVRIGTLEGSPAQLPQAEPEADSSALRSDTGELVWYIGPDGNGLVTVDTPRTQALIGFLQGTAPPPRNLAVAVTNVFGTLILSCLDGEPISRASRLLLTTGTRVENTGQQWNAARTEVTARGGPPPRIDPVRGRIMLRGLEDAAAVHVAALDGAGEPLGAPVPAAQTPAGWVITIGEPATPWYEIVVQR
jgi:hypothetical protein